MIARAIDRLRLMHDIRYATRTLCRRPILTGVAIASLALGIGANAAVFTVLKGVLLDAPRVSDPASLYSIFSANAISAELHRTSFENYKELRPAVPFEMAAYAGIFVAVADESDRPAQLPAELVSNNYFRVLGVRAMYGRTFTTTEGTVDGQDPVVVISASLWRRRFAGERAIIGRTISINTRPFTVIGVAPEGVGSINVARPVDLWIPTSMHKDALSGVDAFYFRLRAAPMFDLVARIPRRVTAAQVAYILRAQSAALAERYPLDDKGMQLSAIPLQQARLDPSRRAAWLRAGGLLASVVSLVLLIACANVANLLLARSIGQRREISLRLALGASRTQIARQLLAEAALLSAGGVVTGLTLAALSLRQLSAAPPIFMPSGFDAGLDLWTLFFAASTGLAATLLIGIGPALYATGSRAMSGIRGDDGVAPGMSRAAFSRGLVMIQSSLATVALILALLFVRSLLNAQRIDPGFRTDDLALVTFDLGMLRYDNVRGPEFVRQVNERVSAIPGVVTSAVASHVVLEGPGLESNIRIRGRVTAEPMGVHAQAVGLNYFRALGLRLVSGRSFRANDSDSSQFGWAIVNETMAARLWPGQSAIGQQFAIAGIPEPYVVVGVVTDSQYESLGEKPRPFFYIYYDQAPGLKKLTLYVRTSVPPATLLPAIEREIHAVDPRLPLTNLRTMKDVLAAATSASRAGSGLLGLFGLIALALALIGTYGVTAFLVSQRNREIGIRIALGASQRSVLLPLVRWTLAPALVGIGAGALVIVSGGRWVTGLLVGLRADDPLSIAVATLTLAVSAGVACLLPALRALRLDPVRVLRSDNG